MRIALISAQRRTENGELRAELMLAGRSILAWQAELMCALGAERVICLCHAVEGEVLRLQHMVEAAGAAFHALIGFTALPALVRAEDDLIILSDGLLPDPPLTQNIVTTEAGWRRNVVCLPAGHAMVASAPDDFERIDAAHNWAGLLVMRGASVQRLSDFAEDADAVSVLLRLALQAGTPLRELGAAELEAGGWLLANSGATLEKHERDLISRAAAARDFRAPLITLAGWIVETFAPRGLQKGTSVTGGLALALALSAVMVAALGAPVISLAFAAAAMFSGALTLAYAGIARRLHRQSGPGSAEAAFAVALDALAALTLWFALVPLPEWSALAMCGPLLIGLARLSAREEGEVPLSAFWRDRASLLVLLASAASAGLLPEATAAFAATALGALLLGKRRD